MTVMLQALRTILNWYLSEFESKNKHFYKISTCKYWYFGFPVFDSRRIFYFVVFVKIIGRN
ncbi:hypothetical protein KUTeg_001781 [Tegillarca granosa]|uniref:Uncharacterized protein n=1 Tax=Tegillarca granosa TaxID=220873 RepID=A0ABQ9FSF3_TEGGR|nr:hypothetical protein KUTeg_001781 [Tegillarca granosa]